MAGSGLGDLPAGDATRRRRLIAEARAAIFGTDVARAECIRVARSVPCSACGAPIGRACLTAARVQRHRLSSRYSQAHPVREKKAGLSSSDGWFLPPPV